MSVSVLANDTDVEGETLSLTAVTQGAHGAVAIAGSEARYTPEAGWVGSDQFTYTVSDGKGGTAVGTVTVTSMAAPLKVVSITMGSQKASGGMNATATTVLVANRSGQALAVIASNIDQAAEGEGPICQDTGWPTYEIKTPVGANQIAMKKQMEAWTNPPPSVMA